MEMMDFLIEIKSDFIINLVISEREAFSKES